MMKAAQWWREAMNVIWRLTLQCDERTLRNAGQLARVDTSLGMAEL